MHLLIQHGTQKGFQDLKVDSAGIGWADGHVEHVVQS